MIRFHVGLPEFLIFFGFLTLLIYWKWFKCWHIYRLLHEISISSRGSQVGTKYISRCEKCGKIKEKEV